MELIGEGSNLLGSLHPPEDFVWSRFEVIFRHTLKWCRPLLWDLEGELLATRVTWLLDLFTPMTA